jgi:hypothetical protein
MVHLSNMSKSRERISPSFFVLLLAIPIFLDGERLCKAIRVRNSSEDSVCDDGKVKDFSSLCAVSAYPVFMEPFVFYGTVVFD